MKKLDTKEDSIGVLSMQEQPVLKVTVDNSSIIMPLDVTNNAASKSMVQDAKITNAIDSSTMLKSYIASDLIKGNGYKELASIADTYRVYNGDTPAGYSVLETNADKFKAFVYKEYKAYAEETGYTNDNNVALPIPSSLRSAVSVLSSALKLAILTKGVPKSALESVIKDKRASIVSDKTKITKHTELLAKLQITLVSASVLAYNSDATRRSVIASIKLAMDEVVLDATK